MELDLLLIVALIIAVVIIAVLALRLFRPVAVTLTVGQGRQITVGGIQFPPSAPATGHESFVVPRSAITVEGDDVFISIRTAENATDQSVSLSRRRLRTLHIDAGLESDIIIYGGYDPPPKSVRSYAKTVWSECKECDDGIFVCGIDPQCR